MRVRSSGIAAVIAGAVAAVPAGAQDLGPRIDSVFAQWQRTDAPGCVVGVRRDGATVHLKAYGMANLEYGVPLTPGSISESGSVAKQFTAAALVLLAQQGRLSLDDDVRRYLPEVPDLGARITIRHLLTHTSGLRDQWALLSLAGWPPGTQVHSVPQIVDLVSHQQRLNFTPGQWYLYSNTGYTLAGEIVSRVTGTPFAEWTREHLFKPIGLNDTQWRDDYRRVVTGRATAYSRSGGGWAQDMPFTRVIGNGGLLTTVPDLLRWNDALTAGTLPGGADLVRQLEAAGRLNDGSEIGYGLGLGLATWRGLRMVSHGGSTAGYRTQLARWPERNLSVAILCNAATANPGAYASQVAERVLGIPPTDLPPSPPVAIAAGDLAGLAGVYRDTLTDQVMTFSVQDGELRVSAGGPTARLTHLGDQRFWSPVAGDYRFAGGAAGWRVLRQDNGTYAYDPHVMVDTAAVRLGDYAGRYHSEELNVAYDLAVAEGRLTLRRAWEPAIRLTPIYADGFAAQGRTVRFSRGADGRVNGLRVFAGRAIDVRFSKLVEGAQTR